MHQLKVGQYMSRRSRYRQQRIQLYLKPQYLNADITNLHVIQPIEQCQAFNHSLNLFFSPVDLPVTGFNQPLRSPYISTDHVRYIDSLYSIQIIISILTLSEEFLLFLNPVSKIKEYFCVDTAPCVFGHKMNPKHVSLQIGCGSE